MSKGKEWMQHSLEEMLTARDLLEDDILTTLRNFQDKYGIQVEGVYLDQADGPPGPQPNDIQGVTVKCCLP